MMPGGHTMESPMVMTSTPAMGTPAMSCGDSRRAIQRAARSHRP
jgi:hypothetical protein